MLPLCDVQAHEGVNAALGICVQMFSLKELFTEPPSSKTVTVKPQLCPKTTATGDPVLAASWLIGSVLW